MIHNYFYALANTRREPFTSNKTVSVILKLYECQSRTYSGSAASNPKRRGHANVSTFPSIKTASIYGTQLQRFRVVMLIFGKLAVSSKAYNHLYTVSAWSNFTTSMLSQPKTKTYVRLDGLHNSKTIDGLFTVPV